MYGLTKPQQRRLGQLADYLEKLPKGYRHFDMESFVDYDYRDPAKAREYAKRNGGVNQCGTTACALGHGPAAGIFFPPRMITGPWQQGNDWAGLDWSAYGHLFTGNGRHSSLLWHWFFAGNWNSVDNHHYGAAARIRYVLAGRRLPDKFDERAVKREDHKLYADFDKRVMA